MSIDLYTDDLNRLANDELHTAIRTTLRIDEPIENRPREDWRLDFKQEWTARTLQSVAGFANTFGGMLIIGVSGKDGRPSGIVGVESVGEIKTSIASSIATNISPTPPYDIAECSLPGEGTRRLCVIRIRQGPELYLLTRKDERHSVYVRNEDQTVPADASQLRALIQQRVLGSGLESDVPSRSEWWSTRLYVNRLRKKDPHSTMQSNERVRSDTSMGIFVLPIIKLRIPLDRILENKFLGIIMDEYPRISRATQRDVHGSHEERDKDWYEFQWLHRKLDYEMRWRITSLGEFGFVTQTARALEDGKDYWSLTDVSLNLVMTLRCAHRFWKEIGFFGDALLAVNLSVLDLLPYGGHRSLFHGGPALNVSGVHFSESPRSGGSADADVNFVSLTSGLPDTVANVLNQLIRSLNHTADVSVLRQEVANFLRGSDEKETATGETGY